MRADAGVALLDLTYLAVGGALLYGIGLVRTWRDALLYAGIALTSGWALVGVGDSLLVTAGLSGTVGESLLLALVLAAAFVVLARRIPGVAPVVVARAPGALGWLAAGGIAVLLVYLEAVFRRSRLATPAAYDAWSFWLPKAESLVYFHGLDTGVGGFTSFANPDYPPFAPAAESLTYRFAGGVDNAILPLQHWVLLVGFFGSLAALLARRVPPWILWPSLAMLGLMPAFIRLVGSSLGDEPLSMVVTLAAVCGLLWVLDREPRFAVLCAVFVAAATLLKNEGMLYGLLLAVLLAAVARGRRVVVPAAVAVAAVAPLVPWKLWLRSHHVPRNPAYDPADLLDPSFLLHHLGRLGTALREMPFYYFSWSYWLLAIPLALVLAVVLARRRPALSAFALGLIAIPFVGNLVVYWVSNMPTDLYIRTSADRTSSTLAVLCAALVPLLAAEALRTTPRAVA